MSRDLRRSIAKAARAKKAVVEAVADGFREEAQREILPLVTMLAVAELEKDWDGVKAVRRELGQVLDTWNAPSFAEAHTVRRHFQEALGKEPAPVSFDIAQKTYRLWASAEKSEDQWRRLFHERREKLYVMGKIIKGFYDVIAHGDSEHRAWLRKTVDDYIKEIRGDLPA